MDAQFTRFSSRVDGSLSFSGSTPELNSTEKCSLMDLQNKNVKLLIQPVDEAPDGITEVKTSLDFKTPSQRLRAVLFVAFRQQKPDMTWEEYYIRKMDRIINGQKSQLEHV